MEDGGVAATVVPAALLDMVRGEWRSAECAASLTPDTVAGLARGEFKLLEAAQRVRLLFALLMLRRRLLAEWAADVDAILRLALDDVDEWVVFAAKMVRPVLNMARRPPSTAEYAASPPRGEGAWNELLHVDAFARAVDAVSAALPSSGVEPMPAPGLELGTFSSSTSSSSSSSSSTSIVWWAPLDTFDLADLWDDVVREVPLFHAVPLAPLPPPVRRALLLPLQFRSSSDAVLAPPSAGRLADAVGHLILPEAEAVDVPLRSLPILRSGHRRQGGAGSGAASGGGAGGAGGGGVAAVGGGAGAGMRSAAGSAGLHDGFGFGHPSVDTRVARGDGQATKRIDMNAVRSLQRKQVEVISEQKTARAAAVALARQSAHAAAVAAVLATPLPNDAGAGGGDAAAAAETTTATAAAADAASAGPIKGGKRRRAADGADARTDGGESPDTKRARTPRVGKKRRGDSSAAPVALVVQRKEGGEEGELEEVPADRAAEAAPVKPERAAKPARQNKSAKSVAASSSPSTSSATPTPTTNTTTAAAAAATTAAASTVEGSSSSEPAAFATSDAHARAGSKSRSMETMEDRRQLYSEFLMQAPALSESDRLLLRDFFLQSDRHSGVVRVVLNEKPVPGTEVDAPMVQVSTLELDFTNMSYRKLRKKVRAKTHG